MKKLLYILLVLLLIPIINAQFEIETIKGYVNNEREPDIDEDGGDARVAPGDKLDLLIELRNDENTTTKAKLKGTLENIDNGDDIVKEQDWYDIDADDERTKGLYFDIPDDATDDDYDLELKITYKFNNGTEEEFNIQFDITVRKEEEDKDTTLDLQNAFRNLTFSCDNITRSLTGCFNYMSQVDTCKNELSTCKEERGTYKTNADNDKENYNSCKSDKEEAERNYQQCENEQATKITLSDCQLTTDEEVKKVNDSKDQMMIGLVAAGALFYFWQKNKKKGLTVADNMYYEKK